jgi:hypothetical protein
MSSKVPKIVASLLLMTTVIVAQGSATSQVKASWYANKEVDLAGYKIYSGRFSQIYTNNTKVSKQDTSYMFAGLSQGTWFFAVTAFDTAENESDFSPEVSITVNQDIPKPRPPYELRVNGKTGSVIIPKGDSLIIEFKTSRLLSDGITLVDKDSLAFRAWFLVPDQGWKSITDKPLPVYGLDRVISTFAFPTETPMNLIITTFYRRTESEDSLPVVVTFQDPVNITVKVRIIL